MNGHPTYKPKVKKKPTTGLFPMHEAANDAHHTNCHLFNWRNIKGCNCGYDTRHNVISKPYTQT
jgi:hypothetical protein